MTGTPPLFQTPKPKNTLNTQTNVFRNHKHKATFNVLQCLGLLSTVYLPWVSAVPKSTCSPFTLGRPEAACVGFHCPARRNLDAVFLLLLLSRCVFLVQYFYLFWPPRQNMKQFWPFDSFDFILVKHMRFRLCYTKATYWICCLVAWSWIVNNYFVCFGPI